MRFCSTLLLHSNYANLLQSLCTHACIFPIVQMHFSTVIFMQFCSTLLTQENYARLVQFLCTHACILQLLKLHFSSVFLMQFCSTLMPQENYSSLEQCLFQELQSSIAIWVQFCRNLLLQFHISRNVDKGGNRPRMCFAIIHATDCVTRVGIYSRWPLD